MSSFDEDELVAKIMAALKAAQQETHTASCPLASDETHTAHHQSLAEILKEREEAAQAAAFSRATNENIKAQVIGWSLIGMIGGSVYLGFLGAIEYIKNHFIR